MPLLAAADRSFVAALSRLAYCNPFLAERIDLERALLGETFVDPGPYWCFDPAREDERPNIIALAERARKLVDQARAALAGGERATPEEAAGYEDAALYLLYDRYREPLQRAVEQGLRSPGPHPISCWSGFRVEYEHYLGFPRQQLPLASDATHLFACLFQVRRAFHHIHDYLVGRSHPAARLRAAVWQSIFSHDMRRYRRSLHRHMGEIATLIVGPSGAGKELVARAVGLSRYIPFDAAASRFVDDFGGSFHPLHLAALSPTLIESELFGHCRGAFTGAVTERAGWFETCGRSGAVFLDEIGEVDPAIQVKLLRVVQSRVFQRLGEGTDRRFEGKLIAATNRDLSEEMRAGRFREDFYYRLCSDVIRTPSLREQLADRPDDLGEIVHFLSQRILPEEADSLAEEATEWIERQLGPEYPWPGNIRELEQCIRNVLIRREYQPASGWSGAASKDSARSSPDATGSVETSPTPFSAALGPHTAAKRLGDDFTSVAVTADELLSRYATLAYARFGSYEQAAQRLGLDRRTVRARIDPLLLARLRDE